MHDIIFDWYEAEVMERRDGTITVDSIFRLKGQAELFAFLAFCRKWNVTVIFANESITVTPNENEGLQDLQLLFYARLSEEPKEFLDYIRYRETIKGKAGNFFS